jgi:hypothetical protein
MKTSKIFEYVLDVVLLLAIYIKMHDYAWALWLVILLAIGVLLQCSESYRVRCFLRRLYKEWLG